MPVFMSIMIGKMGSYCVKRYNFIVLENYGRLPGACNFERLEVQILRVASLF
jgi:hypothetical protein